MDYGKETGVMITVNRNSRYAGIAAPESPLSYMTVEERIEQLSKRYWSGCDMWTGKPCELAEEDARYHAPIVMRQEIANRLKRRKG